MTPTQRPARSRPLPQLTGDSTLGEVIAGYLGADPADGDRRGVRSALSHVAAELGTMPIRRVRPRNVAALLDDLEEAGISPRREAAIVDALHAVFAFAAARGLIAEDLTPARVRRPRERTASEPRAVRTPTLTMVALGARVAFWTSWLIVVGFLVLVLALFLEFA